METIYSYPALVNHLNKLELFVFDLMIGCRAQMYFSWGYSSVNLVQAECRKKYATLTGRKLVTVMDNRVMK